MLAVKETLEVREGQLAAEPWEQIRIRRKNRAGDYDDTCEKVGREMISSLTRITRQIDADIISSTLDF